MYTIYIMFTINHSLDIFGDVFSSNPTTTCGGRASQGANEVIHLAMYRRVSLQSLYPKVTNL